MKRFTAILASLVIASSVFSAVVLAEPDSVTGYDPYVEENIQYDAEGEPYTVDEEGNVTYYTLNYYGYFVPVDDTSNGESSEEPPQESSEEPSEEPSEPESSQEPSEEPSEPESSQETSTEPSEAENSQEPSTEPSEPESSKKPKNNKNSEIPLINYKISALKMNIALPSDVYVITRSGEQSEAALKVFNMTEKEAVESLRKSNMYMKGSPEDFSYDITVTMTQDDDSKTINNFTELDDAELIKITDSLTKQESYTSCTQKKYGDVLYLSLNYKSKDEESGNDIIGVQNYTIVNGQKITVTMQTRGTELSEEQKNIFEAVMKSVSFTEIAPPEVQEDNSEQISMIRLITLATAVVCVILIIVLIVILAKRSKRKKLIAEMNNNDNGSHDPEDTDPNGNGKKRKEKKDKEEKASDQKSLENTAEAQPEPLEKDKSEQTEKAVYTEEDFELFETQPLMENIEIYNAEKSNIGAAEKPSHNAPRYAAPGSVDFMTADISENVIRTPEEAGIHISTETITVPDELDTSDVQDTSEEKSVVIGDNIDNAPEIVKESVKESAEIIVEDVQSEKPADADENSDIYSGVQSAQSNDKEIADTVKTEPFDSQALSENSEINSAADINEKEEVLPSQPKAKEGSLKSFLGKIKNAVVPEIDDDAFEHDIVDNEEFHDETVNAVSVEETEVKENIPAVPQMEAAPTAAPIIPQKVFNSGNSDSRYEKLFGKGGQTDVVSNNQPSVPPIPTVKTESRFEKLFGIKNESTSTEAIQNETFSDIYAAIDGRDVKAEKENFEDSTDNSDEFFSKLEGSRDSAAQKTKFGESVVFEKPIHSNDEDIHDRQPGSSIPKLDSNSEKPLDKPQQNESKPNNPESRYEKLFGGK